MSEFDQEVARSLGLNFKDLSVRDFEIIEYYRRILPGLDLRRTEVALPTYLLVDDIDGDFCIQGEVVGPMSEEAFQDLVSSLVKGIASQRKAAEPQESPL